MTDPLARAHLTLRRGAEFFAAWSASSATPVGHELRSKAVGNGLRELDRFLSLLVDEVARSRGLPAFPHQRNTANKLRRLRKGLGLRHYEHAQLLALGRSRECLLHCAGAARKGDVADPDAMTLGWPDRPDRPETLRRLPLGRAIIVGPVEFASIRDLYLGIALSLDAPAVTSG